MDLSRRSFLASASASAATAAAFALPGAAFSFAAEPAGRAPLLVLVHLRGGCDGLNLVCPSLDPALIEARPSELRVAAEGEGAGFPLGASSGGPAFFLHPQASGLYELHSAGKLAFIHAAGLSAATRSHFVAGDMMDRGVADEGLLLKIQDGWLSRAGRGGDKAPAAGLSASSALAGEFSGSPSSVALSEIGQGGVRPPGGPQSAQALAKMYEGPGKAAAAGRAALAAMSEIDGRLPKSADGKVVPYVPANGADYGPGAELGRSLSLVAQLVKADLGLTAASVELGGWDMHEGEAWRMRDRTSRLSAALSAFWRDMEGRREKMAVVVLSEFGRRLRANKSGGTDHGRGGLAMVLGESVRGGRVLGRWPGLAQDKLDEGVDLAAANDYRSILHEVLVHLDGKAAPAAFPGFKPPASLGLFS